mgnify:CR=1 FL=1
MWWTAHLPRTCRPPSPLRNLPLPSPRASSNSTTRAVSFGWRLSPRCDWPVSLYKRRRLTPSVPPGQTLAPGSRLGFYVCNAVFAERLLRATEVSSQSPSGWSQVSGGSFQEKSRLHIGLQAIITELLTKWGTFGYLQWLASVRDVYCVRRNWMVRLAASVPSRRY